MVVIWKNWKVSIRKIWMGLFSKYFEKRGLFSKYFEKIPPPPGAAAPGGRRRRRRQGYFSKYLENRPLFSKYLEKRPIHIFLIDTFQFFQITIIYKGTQVTTPLPCYDSMIWLARLASGLNFLAQWSGSMFWFNDLSWAPCSARWLVTSLPDPMSSLPRWHVLAFFLRACFQFMSSRIS